jgi:hypothetical protein
MPQTSDYQLERTLSDLAYNTLQDKVPDIISKLIGFQLIKSNKDQTRAIGTFAAQLGKLIVYIPVFFSNGEISGYEIMYIREEDAFVPATEDWIQYVETKSAPSMGQATTKDQRGKGRAANLFPYYDTRYFGKMSSYIVTDAAAGRHIPVYVETADLDKIELPALDLPERKAATARLDLWRVFADPLMGQEKYAQFVARLAKTPGVHEAVFPTYSWDELLRSHYVTEIKTSGDLQKAATRAIVVNMANCDRLPEDIELTDADREAIARGESVLKTRRKDTSRLLRESFKNSMSSITEPGVYEVLTPSGRKKMRVVVRARTSPYNAAAPNPYPGSRSRYDMESSPLGLTFIPENEKGWIEINCYGHDPVFGCADSSDALAPVTPAEMQPGKFYVIAHKGVRCCDFMVQRVETTELGALFVHGNCGVPYDSEGLNRDKDSICFSSRFHAPSEEAPGAASIAQSSATSKFLPANCECFEVRLPDPPEKGPDKYFGSSWIDAEGKLRPLKHSQIFDMIVSGDSTLSLKVSSYDGEFSISVGRTNAPKMGAAAAKRALVLSLDMDEADADHLLKQARTKPVTDYLVPSDWLDRRMGLTKLALAPDIDWNLGETQDPVTGLPATLGYEQRRVIDEMVPDGSIRERYNPYINDVYAPFSQEVVELVQSAARSGDKEILDTAIMSGMVNSGDVDGTIAKYSGDLMVGLDRTCRTYFLFLWHAEECVGRYGKDEYEAIIDALKQVVTLNGKLLIKLKAKPTPSSSDKSRALI